MSMEISLDIFLSIEDIDDILLLFSKTSVENFINTLQIYFQNVDGNQNRICKVSVKYVGYWINLQKTDSF